MAYPVPSVNAASLFGGQPSVEDALRQVLNQQQNQAAPQQNAGPMTDAAVAAELQQLQARAIAEQAARQQVQQQRQQQEANRAALGEARADSVLRANTTNPWVGAGFGDPAVTVGVRPAAATVNTPAAAVAAPSPITFSPSGAPSVRVGAPNARPAEAWRQPTNPLVAAMLPITLHSESRGRRYGPDGQLLTSSAGAQGEMQVMPGTQTDPGFGVRPAADNSPEEIARVGEDYLGAMLRRYNNDPALAWAAYNAGPGRVDAALEAGGANGWLARMPGETQAYVQRNMQMLGQPTQAVPPGFVNPFNPEYFNQALGEINNAEQAALNPFSVTQTLPDRPEMPDLPDMPERDFSAQEAALERMRPVAMSEQERLRISRRNWLSGIGQAMAATPDGAGLGKVLANLGAGALMGRAAGDEEIQARMDRFDERMAQFYALQYQHEGQVSEARYNEAVSEASAMYTHNMNRYNADMEEFRANNSVSVVGNNVVVQTQNGNERNVEVVPIAPAIQAAMAISRAGILSNMAGAQMQGGALVASATNSFMANAAMASYNSQVAGGGNGISGLFQSGAMLATEVITSGIGPQVMGPDVYEGLMETASDQVIQEGFMPGTAEATARQQEIAAMLLYTQSLQNPQLQEALNGAGPVLQENFMVQRAREATTTTRTSRTGTTVTTRE